MRVLKFIVDGQTIRQDPSCDFSGLVPGTEGYLKLQFSFSKEWNGATKVVGFYSKLGKEYTPQVLKNGTDCMVPAEATKNRLFKIRVIGKGSELILRTNKIAIEQKGG